MVQHQRFFLMPAFTGSEINRGHLFYGFGSEIPTRFVFRKPLEAFVLVGHAYRPYVCSTTRAH